MRRVRAALRRLLLHHDGGGGDGGGGGGGASGEPLLDFYRGLALRDKGNTTTVLFVAAQYGSAACVAELLADGRCFVDRANRVGGRGPLFQALERAMLPRDARDPRRPRARKRLFRDYCATIGMLLRGGADPRRGGHKNAGPALNRVVESCRRLSPRLRRLLLQSHGLRHPCTGVAAEDERGPHTV